MTRTQALLAFNKAKETALKAKCNRAFTDAQYERLVKHVWITRADFVDAWAAEQEDWVAEAERVGDLFLDPFGERGPSIRRTAAEATSLRKFAERLRVSEIRGEDGKLRWPPSWPSE